tara:strand:+ start:88 stop:285 length:198 start_codon:yes stop_codon:yes gene_type:complete
MNYQFLFDVIGMAIVAGIFATVLIQIIFTLFQEASWKDAVIIGGVIFLCICTTGIVVMEQQGLLY